MGKEDSAWESWTDPADQISSRFFLLRRWNPLGDDPPPVPLFLFPPTAVYLRSALVSYSVGHSPPFLRTLTRIICIYDVYSCTRTCSL